MFIKITVWLTLLTTQLLHATPNESAPLHLKLGQDYPLEGLVADSIEVSPKELGSLFKNSSGFLFKPLAVGHGYLLVHSQNQSDLLKIPISIEAEPQQWFSERPDLSFLPKGLKLENHGSLRVCSGWINNKNIYQKLLFIEKHTKSFVLLARPLPGIKETLLEQASRTLNDHELFTFEVKNWGNRFLLFGQANTPNEIESAIEWLTPILPNIENRVAVPLSNTSMVHLKLTLLEVNKLAQKELGISWKLAPDSLLHATPKRIFFDPEWIGKVKFLESKGHIKTVSEPQLLVKEGSSAELKVGGELPIRVVGRDENKVIWKHFGIELKISLLALESKRARIKLHSESSSVDTTLSVDGVPGIKSNHLNTELDLEDGTPLLVSGLIQKSNAKEIENVPILGSLPLLGTLFSASRDRENESELWVAIFPKFGALAQKIPRKILDDLQMNKYWTQIH